MSTLAKALRQSCLPIIKKLYPQLITYLQNDRDVEDHTQVIGMFACFLEQHPPLHEFFYKDITQYIINIPSIESLQNDELYRNSAYCIGLITFFKFCY